nr:hypothetical protein [Tanacetum cinerariifolium]
DRVFKIKNAIGNKQYKPEDVQELFCKLINDVQNIHEELDEYINIPSWNRPAFSNHDDDDDEDYTIAITPDEPDNSLNQFEEFSDSNDDSTSIDDNYLSIDNIDYIEASPPDSEFVSLEEPPSLFPIPSKDGNSFLEMSYTSLSYWDNYLPEFETFSNYTGETNSGSITTHADYSLPKYDSFLFEMEPDQGELTSVVMKDNLIKPRVHVPNVLTIHPTLMMDSDFIPSDNSLPESEIFYFDIEEKNSGSTTIHVDISLSDLKYFNFKREPDPSELTSIVDFGIRENILSATNVNLPPEEDHSPLFAYVRLCLLLAPPRTNECGDWVKLRDPKQALRG